MARPTDPNRFLDPAEADDLACAVREAESRTSAEIRVVLVRHCWGDLRRKAIRTFRKLELDRTVQRNCVMIMLVLANHEFLIYGDRGIHEQVGQGFWDETRDLMARHFADGEFGEGLCAAVRQVGEKLAALYPWREDDVNEIPDEFVMAE